jgi:rare lipoprotein A
VKRVLALLLCVLLAACGGGKQVKKPAPHKPASSHGTTQKPGKVKTARPDKPGEYTPGGLYKPGVADSGPAIPPDVSKLPEPVPRDEPLSKYGNRSPYTVLGKSYHVMKSADGYVERGIASWYGEKFHGRATSSMEPYDMYEFTAAHKTLPLPTYARVTNLENGRSVVVRVNDRGPFHDQRLIDLSYAAAVKLGVHVKGTAHVEVRALKPGQANIPPPPVPTSPAPAPASTSGSGTVFLQAGSFGEQANARRLMERLEAAHLGRIELQKAQVAGRTVWRVRIGPFPTRDAAQTAAERARELGFGPPSIVAE